MSIDLRTPWLGLPLANPLVASPQPMTGQLDLALRMEDAGISALVLPSLFEEQVEQEELEMAWAYTRGTDSFGEAQSWHPDVDSVTTGPDPHLERLRRMKERLGIPVIASLNGTTPGGWVRYARLFEEAGADALELNIYLMPTDPAQDGRAVEEMYLALVRQVKEATSLPLAVKLGPWLSAPLHMAGRLAAAGATGLVLFNRFYQPDIDLEHLVVTPRVHLSTSEELRLSLRWIALMRGRVPVDLAGSTGVHEAEDVLKLLLAGADVTMMASALMRHGPDHPRRVLAGVREWMEAHEYHSVAQLKGSMSQVNAPHPELFERANYMRTLTTFTGWSRGGGT